MTPSLPSYIRIRAGAGFKPSPIIFIFIIVWLLMVGSVHAQDATSEPPRGTVGGMVSSGTTGGTVPADLRVFLVVADETTNLFTQDTIINPDGSYQFENVPLLQNAVYTVVTAYRERIFQNILTLTTLEQTNINLPLTIYDLTEDSSVIRITDLVIQMDAVGDRLEVQQFIRFQNTSDRAFTSSTEIGDNRYPSVLLALPPGAQVVGTGDVDVRFVNVPERFTLLDTNPVLPGDDHTVAITYLLPYDSRSAIIEQELYYAITAEVRLLVWPQGLTVTSTLDTLGSETIGEKTYQVYQKNITSDEGIILGYELRGSTAPGASQPNAASAPANPLPLLLLIIVGGVVLIAAILILKTRQSATIANSDRVIDALLRELAAIDEQHRSGQLNHDLWHKQRAQIKARLNQLTGEDQHE